MILGTILGFSEISGIEGRGFTPRPSVWFSMNTTLDPRSTTGGPGVRGG